MEINNDMILYNSNGREIGYINNDVVRRFFFPKSKTNEKLIKTFIEISTFISSHKNKVIYMLEKDLNVFSNIVKNILNKLKKNHLSVFEIKLIIKYFNMLYTKFGGYIRVIKKYIFLDENGIKNKRHVSLNTIHNFVFKRNFISPFKYEIFNNKSELTSKLIYHNYFKVINYNTYFFHFFHRKHEIDFRKKHMNLNSFTFVLTRRKNITNFVMDNIIKRINFSYITNKQILFNIVVKKKLYRKIKCRYLKFFKQIFERIESDEVKLYFYNGFNYSYRTNYLYYFNKKDLTSVLTKTMKQ